LGWRPRKRRFPNSSFSVATRVSERVFRQLERVIWVEGYMNVGDYLRNLIRKDFKERGISVHDVEGVVKREEEGKKEEESQA